MKKVTLFFIFLIHIGFPAVADNCVLCLEEMLRLVLENHPDYRQAGYDAAYAVSNLEAARAERYPELGLDMGYSGNYVTRKQDQYGNEYEDYLLQGINAGVYLWQLLPSYGTVRFGVSNLLTLSDIGSLNGTDVDLGYSQSPLISLSFRQPVFVNGRFVDGRIYGAVLREQELMKLSAMESKRAAKNEAITEALVLSFAIQNLRNTINQQEKAIEIRNQSLARLSKNLEGGTVAATDVEEMKIEIGKEKEILLQTVYELSGKEDQMRSVLGYEPGRAVLLDESLFDEDWLSHLARLQSGWGGLEQNPRLKLRKYEAAGNSLVTILNGMDQAGTLSASLSLEPRYSYVRTTEWGRSWASSFDDFYDPDAGMDISFSLTMSVPLYDAGAGRHLREADRAREKVSNEALSLEMKVLTMQMDSFSARKTNLEERARLLQDNLKLMERQREIAWKLLNIGEISELELADLEVDYIKKRNELKKTHMDTFLVALERLSLLGLDLEKELTK